MAALAASGSFGRLLLAAGRARPHLGDVRRVVARGLSAGPDSRALKSQKAFEEETLREVSQKLRIDASERAPADWDDEGKKEGEDEKGEADKEAGGPRGLEPTRYGDWESKGRCWDF